MSAQFLARFKFVPNGRVLGFVYNKEEKTLKLTLSEDIDDESQRWIVWPQDGDKGYFLVNSKYRPVLFCVDFDKLDPAKRFGPVRPALLIFPPLSEWYFESGPGNRLKIRAQHNDDQEVTEWSLVEALGDTIQVEYENKEYNWSMIRIRDLKPEEYVKAPTGETNELSGGLADLLGLSKD